MSEQKTDLHVHRFDENTKRRLNALRNIQIKIYDIESTFYEELYKLERKFSSLYEPLYDQRDKIVNGKHDPSDEEVTWPYENDTLEGCLTTNCDHSNTEAQNSIFKGVENFWLDAFKSTNILLDKIQEHDEPILKHLTDVRCKINDQIPLGFTIEFFFSENEFFTNKVLTKSFEISIEKDKDHPFKHENGSLYKSLGCSIDWKANKDVTVVLSKKKQNNKGVSRVVSKEEQQDSFFLFFKTHTSDGIRPSFKKSENAKESKKTEEKKEDQSEEEEPESYIEYLFDTDYEIAQTLKENIIPKALLFFTGELNDGLMDHPDDDFDSEDDDDDDDDDNDDDEEDDEDEDEEKNKNGKGANPRKKNKV